jgi:hypothetical protein
MEPMNIELEQLSEFLLLMEKREETITDLTNEILDRIEPYVLDVLYELFDLPISDVDWVDVQVINKILMVTSAVAYDPHNIPQFIKKLFVPDRSDYNEEVVHKMIQVGIPISYIFGPREKLLEFFANLVKDSPVDKNKKVLDNVSFDVSRMNDEDQLKLLANTKTGRAH